MRKINIIQMGLWKAGKILPPNIKRDLLSSFSAIGPKIKAKIMGAVAYFPFSII